VYWFLIVFINQLWFNPSWKKLQFVIGARKILSLPFRIDHSQESEIKHRFSPDSFVNLADAKYSIGLVYACLFSIYRAERWKSWHEFTVQFSILFSTVVSPSVAAPFFRPSTLVATACSNTPVRHPPLFTTSKRRRCFFPLWCSKNFIRSLSSSNTNAEFMKFGDLKLLRRVLRVSCRWFTIRVVN